MCLGFDVDDGVLREVTYVRERTALEMPPTKESEELLFTKYIDWRYEEEWRIAQRLVGFSKRLYGPRLTFTNFRLRGIYFSAFLFAAHLALCAFDICAFARS